jgi:hypothetical protein
LARETVYSRLFSIALLEVVVHLEVLAVPEVVPQVVVHLELVVVPKVVVKLEVPK